MSSGTEKRVAIVTGASRGIGRAIALQLAAQGRHVVCVARNSEKLAQVVSEIESQGGTAEAISCDMTDPEAVKAMVDQVAKSHKRLDILVNNAGITRDNLLMRMSDEEFDDVIATNLKSVFIATRAAVRPMMKGKWGRIVNISSVAGLMGNAGQVNYASAKAGLLGMTKSVAREVGGKGVTANVVAPGFTETDMTSDLPEQVKAHVLEATALSRFGQPGEIAAAVAFLTSDAAGYITGQTLAVDGGMTMM